MNLLGTLRCVDCGGTHDIYKGAGGLLATTSECPGRSSGSLNDEQRGRMSQCQQEVTLGVSELNDHVAKEEWKEVQDRVDQLIRRLNDIHEITGEKS